MTEFNELPTNDKRIICKLIRMRLENVYAEMKDFDGLSEEGLKYYQESVIESIPEDVKKEMGY